MDNIVIDGVEYSYDQVKKALKGKGRTVYRLKRDFVIPGGTEFHVSRPGETRKLISEHATLEIAITKDVTMSITVDLEDAHNIGLLEKRVLL